MDMKISVGEIELFIGNVFKIIRSGNIVCKDAAMNANNTRIIRIESGISRYKISYITYITLKNVSTIIKNSFIISSLSNIKRLSIFMKK